MKILPGYLALVIMLGIASCNTNKTREKTGNDSTLVVTTHIVEVEEKEEPTPPPPPPFRVSAQMIYDDGSLSSFDVLNDKTRALWNVIIGAGDAEKPSEKTRLMMRADFLDSVDIVVRRGKYTVLNKKNLIIRDSMSFVLDNTGCEEIVVAVTRGKSTMYKGMIEYHCGE
jgi:hypothetical protein